MLANNDDSLLELVIPSDILQKYPHDLAKLSLTKQLILVPIFTLGCPAADALDKYGGWNW